MFKWNFSCFSLCPSRHWISLRSSKRFQFFTPHHQMFNCPDKVSPLFYKAEQSQLSASPCMTDAPVPWWSQCPGLSPVCPHLPCIGEPRTGHSTAGVASPVLSRGAGWARSTFLQHFLMQPRILWAAFAARAHCWPMVSRWFTKSFSAKLCFIQLSPHPCKVHLRLLPGIFSASRY